MAAEYFVDPTATANGSGTEASPFSSLANLDAGSAAANDDIIYVRAGTICREAFPVSCLQAHRIKLRTYGGATPARISGFDVVKGWTYDAATDLWSKTISNGWVCRVNGHPLTLVLWPGSVGAAAATMSSNSFSFSGTVLYLRLDFNPNEQLVEVSARQYCMSSGSGYAGLDIEGLAFDGAYRNLLNLANKTGFRIIDTYFGMHGGENPGSFYIGNAIELYSNNVDGVIERCVFEDSFDSAISPQLGGTTIYNRRLRFRFNEIRRAGYAGIEVTTNAPAQVNDGIEIAQNKIVDGGRGWSGNRGGRGITIQGNNTSDATSIMTGIDIVANEIANCRTGVLIRDSNGTNLVARNRVIGGDYGIVARQAIAATHGDEVWGNVIHGAAVAAFMISGASDGIHGSGTATNAITWTLKQNTVVGGGTAVLNTSNSNASITLINNIIDRCETAFDCSVGTLTETYNDVHGCATIGVTLDATDKSVDPQFDEYLTPTNAEVTSMGLQLNGRDLYGVPYPAAPSVGAVQALSVARSTFARPNAVTRRSVA